MLKLKLQRLKLNADPDSGPQPSTSLFNISLLDLLNLLNLLNLQQDQTMS
jgi:hypothetical protein